MKSLSTSGSHNTQDHLRRGDDMSNETNAAEPSGASAGSQLLEQIAALVHDAMRFDRETKTPKWQGGNSYAESRARQAAWQIATLFQPTLTDEEREALNRGIDALYGVEDVSDGACRRDDAAARTLLALLERLT
jgi:hypothetical protein